MRIGVLFLLLLVVLGGCVGSQRRPVKHPPSRPIAVQPEDPKILRQCLVDLGNAGAQYQLLPDRVFGGGCSATGAVKLLAIGIPITNLGAVKCRTAERLTIWTQEAVQKAATAWLDARVVKMESFGSYACRPVNNQAGNRLSEHGRANAVDISAFVLADGRRITVEQGWRSPDENVRNFLRAVHKAACRRFNIVIGPDGDAAHHNHFHFDMGPNGPYCR